MCIGNNMRVEHGQKMHLDLLRKIVEPNTKQPYANVYSKNRRAVNCLLSSCHEHEPSRSLQTTVWGISEGRQVQHEQLVKQALDLL